MRHLFLLLIAVVITSNCFGGDSPSVVFIGDSLTAWWDLSAHFPNKLYVDKGVPGNTTAQMLERFDTDVIALHPAAVVIWGGTNSLGKIPAAQVEQELAGMYSKAQHAGIRVIACTISPRRADNSIDLRDLTGEIQQVNAWIRQYAPAHDIAVADLYPVLADSIGWLKKDLTPDFVHLTAKGYKLISPIAASSIERVVP
jgi:acyl-CoA thioesterase-1